MDVKLVLSVSGCGKAISAGPGLVTDGGMRMVNSNETREQKQE